tara:strand:- start:3970 stop:5277 length:1308 start_codon:yes stop_codon:yes gene_type:complete
MTTISFNYYNFLKFSLGFILIGNLARSASKTMSSVFELAILIALLSMALIYLSENFKIKSRHTLIFFIFLSYLMAHTIFASVYRPIELNGTFYEILFYNLSEFRLSTLGYFLPLVFIPIIGNNTLNLEKFIITLLKVVIIYSLIEQTLSLLGLRTLFETLYMSSGVVSDNLIGVKSLGMYRIWGLIGSPQLLGVFHLISLIYFLDKKERIWSAFSIIAIIISTSKTAYALLIIYVFVYLIQKRYYFALLFLLLIFSAIAAVIINFYLYYTEMNMTEDYPNFIKVIGSVHGYFLLALNYAESSAPERFIAGGPLYQFIQYFSVNPLEIFFGKGITYSIYQDTSSLVIAPYHYLTSDYYILTFFEQYGLLGLFLISYVFFYYPLKSAFNSNALYYGVPIIFFLSMFHYPPQISKLMMIIVSFAIYKIYLIKKEQNVN